MLSSLFFVCFCVLLVAAFHHTIVKHFNFVGDSAQGTPSPAYGIFECEPTARGEAQPHVKKVLES